MDSFSIYFCTRITISLKGNQIENRKRRHLIRRRMTIMKILVKLTRRAGNACIASLSRSVFLCDYDMPFRAAFCLSQNESLRETIHIKKNYVKISPADSFSRTRTNSFSYERFYMSSHFETEAQGKSEMALGSYRLLCCKSRTELFIFIQRSIGLRLN